MRTTFNGYFGCGVYLLASSLALACGDEKEPANECGIAGDSDGAGRAGSGSAGTGGSTATGGADGGAGAAGAPTGETVLLKEAKLIIEHNATDLDTGFQGFLDGEGWKRIDIVGPAGKIATFEGQGPLRDHGLTELFFETVEPENAEVPIDDLLQLMPAGEYTFRGPTVDGGWTEGKATLTHAIPAGPVLVSPKEGATVPPTGLVVSWEPVTEGIDGAKVTITSYQLIIEKDEPPPTRSIGKRGLSMYLGPDINSITVPDEFLEAATPYLWEVLAIEESGNQTLTSGSFTTE